MDGRSETARRKLSLYPTNHPLPTEVGPSRLLASRPLSDIREITEPSLYEPIHRKVVGDSAPLRRPSRAGALKRNLRRPESKQSLHSPLKSTRLFDDRSSVYSIPRGSVPPRSSSKVRDRRSVSVSRAPAVVLPPPKLQYHCVVNNSQSHSPVKEAFSKDPDFAKRGRVPSRTIVKDESPISDDILSHPTHLHPRVKLEVLLVAPLFVGGSSVEGTVRIIVDEADRARHRKTLTVERLSIDLLGIEQVSGGRRYVFLALGNELVDLTHPPPPDMVESSTSAGTSSRSWILSPSVTTLPFLVRLPLEVGPPPFQSKHASIRYLLCATLIIRDGGRQLCVRCSQETAALSVYDPEKALMSLPSPLTVQETSHLPRGSGQEYITITAGLHRQVWVSGTNIFADVYIINNSHKTIKKLELQLERRVLCYRHAAAATREMSASQARIFDQDERLIAARTSIKAGAHGWNGVAPYTTVLRTCDLELPRNHATIKCNKYFEVRYFLNVVVGMSHLKTVTVQLPIILIHMNSLDIPTNSVAQVAAAIEEKRGVRPPVDMHGSPRVRRKPSRVLQGRAFNAPRTQSLERTRRQQEEMAELSRLLDASPRKKSYQQEQRSVRQMPSSSFSFKTPPSNRKGRIMTEDTAEEIRRRLGHVKARSNASTRSAGGLVASGGRSSSVVGLGGGGGAGGGAAGGASRASSALGHYLLNAEEDGGEGSGMGSFGLEDVNLGRGKTYAASSKAASLVSSFEIRRPKWAGRPGWMKGAGNR